MKRLQPLFPSSEAEEIRKRVRALLPHKDASASATGGIRAAGHLSEFEFYMEADFVTGVVADEIETYLGYNPPPPGRYFALLEVSRSHSARALQACSSAPFGSGQQYFIGAFI